MRLISGYRLVLGAVVSLTLGITGALILGVDHASAQDVTFRGQCAGGVIAGLGPACNDNSGGDARAAGGNGGNGGLFTIVHDVGNAEADASNLVIVHDITTGDATASDVNVDAAGATRPVVVSVAGSFIDTGVDIFAPGGSPQAGTTGGNGNIADSSGGPGGDGGNGGDAHANGGNGGDITNVLLGLLGLP
jgi:hypothetical protein